MAESQPENHDNTMHSRPHEETAAGRYSEEVASMEGLEARVAALAGQMATRVGALEERMGVIRKDAAAARLLAGGADRDVADISAKLDVHKSLIQALHTTQIDQGNTLLAVLRTQVNQGNALQTVLRTQTEHGTRLDVMQGTLTEHGTRLDAMQGTLTEHGTRLDAMQETLAVHSENFAKLAAGQAVITDLLTRHLEDGSTN